MAHNPNSLAGLRSLALDQLAARPDHQLRRLKALSPDGWFEAHARAIVQRFLKGYGSPEIAAQVFKAACDEHVRIKCRQQNNERNQP